MPEPFPTFDGTDADLAIVRGYEDGVRYVLAVAWPPGAEGEQEIVAAFDSYRRHLNPRSRLMLLTTSREPERAVEAAARLRSRLVNEGEAVVRTGPLNAAQLKAYFLLTHVFLCANHGREACPLLVQALRARVPCVAWGRRSALAPLAGHALVWQRPGPEVIAESIQYCLENLELLAKPLPAAADATWARCLEICRLRQPELAA